MTTCPMCDTIRIVRINEYPYEKAWHMNCDCGWAWAHSGYFGSRIECVNRWERQIAERERASKHAVEARQSRQ